MTVQLSLDIVRRIMMYLYTLLMSREIVGSIAGDDTIMMAVRTVEDTKVLMEKIKAML